MVEASGRDAARGGFRPQVVRRPREQVEEQIRRAILSGELSAGDRLPSESELAAQFGVSRATVREALRVIVAQGLIAKVPGARGGSFVRSVDHDSLRAMLQESVGNLLALGAAGIDEVTAVRQHLEVPSARLAAAHRTEDHVALLRKIVDEERASRIDDPRIPELDVEFHSTVARASGNRLLASIVEALHRVTRPVDALDLSPRVGCKALKQHEALVRAIERQDPDAAQHAVADHVSYLRRHTKDPLLG